MSKVSYNTCNLLGQLNRVCGIIAEFASSESPKRTEWGLLEMTTILNTARIHSNLVE